MKKKIIISSILIALVIVAVAIPKEVYQKWFGKTSVEDPVNKVYQQVYLKNNKGLLVGLKVEVGAIAEDEIVQKWNLLTKDSDLIPVGYSSTINKEVELEKYEISGSTLILHVNDKIFESDGRYCAETIAWTFTDNEINEIILKVNEEVINKIGDFQFRKLNKKLGINFNYETSFLFEANCTTVLYYFDDYTLPVSYFHLDGDCYSYVFQKIFESDSKLSEVSFNYVLNEKELNVVLNSSEIIEQSVFKMLSDTLALNFDLDKFVVTEDDSLLYEMVYKVIE